jgi:NAD(P)H dehydrogenase (quinone)
MRHLIVVDHPSDRGYAAAAAGWLRDDLHAAGDRVTTVQLSGLGSWVSTPLGAAELAATRRGEYDAPTSAAFAELAAHDTLTLAFPLWWVGFPARMKAWIDRVFAAGLAYDLVDEQPVPRLGGRRAGMILTLGSALADYERDGTRAALEGVWDRHLLGFCGFEPAGYAWLDDAARADEHARARHRTRVAELAARLLHAPQPCRAGAPPAAAAADVTELTADDLP